MKKIYSAILAAAMMGTSLMIPCASADSITIDLETATNEELSSIVQSIQDEKVRRYKESLASRQIEPDTDGITFRGIPWFTTLAEAEKILGITSESWERRLGELCRLGSLDYQSIYSDYVEGELGCDLWYDGLSVAGYTPTESHLCYICPIVDGQILRDPLLAECYMGYYTFEDSDFGDLTPIYEDLLAKLNGVYGEGTTSNTEYFNRTFWRDQDGNTIRLQVNDSAYYMTLAYVAADADKRLDEMALASNAERTRAAEEERQRNVNNTDGL